MKKIIFLFSILMFTSICLEAQVSLGSDFKTIPYGSPYEVILGMNCDFRLKLSPPFTSLDRAQLSLTGYGGCRYILEPHVRYQDLQVWYAYGDYKKFKINYTVRIDSKREWMYVEAEVFRIIER